MISGGFRETAGVVLLRKCEAIPPEAVILELKNLQDEGCEVDDSENTM